MAYIRDANGDPREVIDLDGVGGVSILARAKIFRQGTFPSIYILNHAETEAFGKMAKKWDSVLVDCLITPYGIFMNQVKMI